MKELAVSEVFGPTFQGEGPHAGKLSVFLRLGGCNLACSWCDTPYTWDWTGRNGLKYDPKAEVKKMTSLEVIQAVKKVQAHHLVVTGGEPMLQQEGLMSVLMYLSLLYSIEVETNGTMKPEPSLLPYIHHFDVSPKLSNAGSHGGARHYVLDALKALAATGRASFKFVVKEEADLEEIDNMVIAIYGSQAVKNIWVMPEGRGPSEVLTRARNLADAVLLRGYNLTLRTHVLLWGNERGR